MKKLFSIVAFLSMAMLVSCSDNKVEATAKSFLESTANADFAEAKKYCDEATGSMLGMAEGMIDPAKREEIKKQGIKIQIVSSEVKDSTAVVKYQSTSKDKPKAEGEPKELKLVKVGDEWKVTMGKEAPKGGVPAPPAPGQAPTMTAPEAPATEAAPAAPAQ